MTKYQFNCNNNRRWEPNQMPWRNLGKWHELLAFWMVANDWEAFNGNYVECSKN